ncbi:MAG: tyrosine-protein phosphatase [Oscillospiraceae bacterium]|nr:tyrosine-protein phosphatase [Oscillospiraceae bacterium]
MRWNNRWIKRIVLVLAVMCAVSGAEIVTDITVHGETAPAKLLFEDNFDGNSLDETKWKRLPETERCEGMTFWDNDYSYLNGKGQLVLEADWDENEGRVLCGAVGTDESFSGGYGYYEASIRFPKQYGIWGAFWSMVGDVTGVDNSSADGVELDIIESILSDEQLCNHAIHWDNYDENKKTDSKTHEYLNIYDGEFHTFGLWRTESAYIFYVDGEETWRSAAGGICPLGGDIRLTVEAAAWAGAGTPEAIAALPAHMDVDFVRVWDTNPYIGGEYPIPAETNTGDIEVRLRIDDPVMTVNGAKKQIDEQGTAPILQNERTLLPVRALVEEFGGEVQWNDAERAVTLFYGEDTVKLCIDSTTAYLNGESYALDVAPVIREGRTMLPVRFIAESFHWNVIWKQETREIIIQKFAAVPLDVGKFTFQSQRLWIGNARNARQLGGYVMKDGRKIKKDVLLRSAALAWLDEEDIKMLRNKYNVKYVIDFRGDTERAEDPNKEIPGAEYIAVPLYGGDLYTAETWSRIDEIEPESGDRVERALSYAQNGIITERYERVLLSETAQKALKEFFDTLLAAGEGEAVLWNCSAGKDRTGVASAMLMFALGADEDMVIRDFEITNEAYEEDIARMRAIAAEMGLDEETTIAFLTASDGTYGKYMRMLVDSADREYGSIDNYLKTRIGLSDEDIAALQEKYLEK